MTVCEFLLELNNNRFFPCSVRKSLYGFSVFVLFVKNKKFVTEEIWGGVIYESDW